MYEVSVLFIVIIVISPIAIILIGSILSELVGGGKK
jgi:hypothetical protein